MLLSVELMHTRMAHTILSSFITYSLAYADCIYVIMIIMILNCYNRKLFHQSDSSDDLKLLPSVIAGMISGCTSTG